MNYYNEFDPGAAEWLRQLIKDGLIPYGWVDTASIEDVRPSDLVGFTQRHFFAGIGGWSRALQLAGWPTDMPVWTGSCPCQSFSTAGEGAGFADQRHLWPHLHWLIEQCRPPVVFGEQVASKDGRAWLDLVQSDLEGSGYASGAANLCAAGVGLPHIRQRLYWVAHHRGTRLEVERVEQAWRQLPPVERGGEIGILADIQGDGRREKRQDSSGCDGRNSPQGRPAGLGSSGRPVEWIYCRDNKWRPVEPGTFPLVDGFPRGMVPVGTPYQPQATAEMRAIRLKGYGNAIVPSVASEFILGAIECLV